MADGVDVRLVVPEARPPAPPAPADPAAPATTPAVPVPAGPTADGAPLPRTGAELTAVLLVAVLLLVLGSLIVSGASRRRARPVTLEVSP